MADFNAIRALNPTATPSGTDLVVVQKADGNPAAYTLNELSAFIVGASQPTWQTDAAHGCYLTVMHSTGTYSIPDSIIPFNIDGIVWDTGFWANEGVVIIPTGVIKIQIIAQIKTTNDSPTLYILKDADLIKPIAVVKGAGGYALVVSPEIAVQAGDSFNIYCEGAGSFLTSETYMNVRTIEKTI